MVMNIPILSLDRVEAPIDEARGLSNPWYTHESCFITERDTIFSNNWTCVAFTHDVSESGSVYPVNLMGIPLLVVRDREYCVRVFHNVCSHRGVQLVDGAQKLSGMLCCPYHSWTYDLTGRLVATPHVGGINTHQVDGLDCAKHGLKAVRCHEWMGLIFVDLNGALEPFESRIESLLARWDAWIPERNYDDLEADPAHGQLEIELACNWKLAVENYCEAYHLPWVHPGLNTYSRLDDHYNIESYGNYSGQGSLVYRQLEGSNGAKFADFKDLDAKWDTAAEYLSVYPNVLLGMHRDHAFAIVLVPNGPEETEENIHLYYATPETDAELRAKNTEQWKVVFEEDIFVVEGMQRGRHGVNFDGGRVSPAMDGPTHWFHDWVAGKVSERRAMANAAE